MNEELSPVDSEVIDRFCQALAQALRRLLSSDSPTMTLTDLAQPIEAAHRSSGDRDEH